MESNTSPQGDNPSKLMRIKAKFDKFKKSELGQVVLHDVVTGLATITGGTALSFAGYAMHLTGQNKSPDELNKNTLPSEVTLNIGKELINNCSHGPKVEYINNKEGERIAFSCEYASASAPRNEQEEPGQKQDIRTPDAMQNKRESTKSLKDDTILDPDPDKTIIIDTFTHATTKRVNLSAASTGPTSEKKPDDMPQAQFNYLTGRKMNAQQETSYNIK